MKVLWFSVTPARYEKNSQEHNGGGWISALERCITMHNEVELGIAFLGSSFKKEERNKVTYYSLFINRNFIEKIIDRCTYKYIDELIIKEALKVINDFKPDLIHIWGTEWCYGLLKNYTKIPIVIHMQGCWPVYHNAMLPPGVSFVSEMLRRWYTPKGILGYWLNNRLSKERAIREEKILRINENYMGRTHWDKAIVKLYSPNSKYYLCNECLRDEFIENKKFLSSNNVIKKIVTVGGGHFLKGYDVIFKTASIIKKESNINFEWILLGPSSKDLKQIEYITKIKYNDINIIPLGRCEEDRVINELLSSNIYIHASYADNSPNAICEAQYLGLPVISTNVGGIPSLFSKDYPMEFLVPTNDPYYLASKIIMCLEDDVLLEKLGKLNYELARERHDDYNIYTSITSIYRTLIKS